MPNPYDRRRIAAAHRNRFNRQYAEYVATLDAGDYLADDIIEGFLTYFNRDLTYENREEVRNELTTRGIIDDDGNIVIA